MGPGLRCVVESMNYSACGHQAGDSFEVDDDGLRIHSATGGFCFFAVSSILPLLMRRLGAAGTDEWLASGPVVMCPDPPEGLRMRIEAIGTEQEGRA
jgi:uncharacterized repeat protein (TIGR04076 family)